MTNSECRMTKEFPLFRHLRGLHTLYPQETVAVINSQHEIKNTFAGFGRGLVHGNGCARVRADAGDLRAASALNQCCRRIERDRAATANGKRGIERFVEGARAHHPALQQRRPAMAAAARGV